jgi:hypothetical protein
MTDEERQRGQGAGQGGGLAFLLAFTTMLFEGGGRAAAEDAGIIHTLLRARNVGQQIPVKITVPSSQIRNSTDERKCYLDLSRLIEI